MAFHLKKKKLLNADHDNIINANKEIYDKISFHIPFLVISVISFLYGEISGSGGPKTVHEIAKMELLLQKWKLEIEFHF